MLPKVWPAMEYLNVNTVEIPGLLGAVRATAGAVRPQRDRRAPGGARQHHVRLVLLWFGTWKNGSQHYMPEWMKLAPDRYPHLIDKNGRPADSPSPFAAASLEADKTAFTAFMRYLKAADPQRTVIMVQVENEPGTWGPVRDYSPAAQKLFEAPVPADVLTAMQVKPGSATATWQEAFGPEAEVCFHAWAVAKYVGQVAAAGKAVYPLPLYANAALRDPIKPGAPGSYESGGPTDNVIPIWKVAAPALDLVAPDIYQNDPAAYLKVLELYHRDDNALFVPETGGGPGLARFFFSALGLQAIGFSPFGMDYTNPRNTPESLAPWALNYRLIAPMQREIARLNFEGKLQAVAEKKGEVTQTLAFGAWNAMVSYGAVRNGGRRGTPNRRGASWWPSSKTTSSWWPGSTRVDFRPADAGKYRQFLRVEEGVYENGVFKFLRIWNGDETDWGLNFGAEPLVLRVSLATY